MFIARLRGIETAAQSQARQALRGLFFLRPHQRGVFFGAEPEALADFLAHGKRRLVVAVSQDRVMQFGILPRLAALDKEQLAFALARHHAALRLLT
jgi:hypothetical protein